MSLSLTPKVCDNCGYRPDFTDVDGIGKELVYLATKAIDDPWLCKACR